ncbi:hypothetical protein [Bacteroides pyogenes]|nr:hypothetical protein [Bacteroides pyogenes]MBR8705795.1 hypothetical protein [Bacteroides pyogenes]MBR8808428.1 hypothetical protein [Bacteroides pyogenes]
MKHYFEKEAREYRNDYEHNLIRFHFRNFRYGAIIGTVLGLLRYFGII